MSRAGESWYRHVERSLNMHRRWQEREAERMTNEIWDQIVGSPQGTDMFGDSHARVAKAKLKKHKAYTDLSDSTVEILERLGR